ncbi:MAG: hypothetical protein AAGE93_16595, partial [Bacteroidota bacterium]
MAGASATTSVDASSAPAVDSLVTTLSTGVATATSENHSASASNTEIASAVPCGINDVNTVGEHLEDGPATIPKSATLASSLT